MPESPVFDAVAAVFRLELEEKLSVAIGPSRFREQLVNHLVEQLRLVWNARGAADMEALDAEIWTRRDAETLRKLDR